MTRRDFVLIAHTINGLRPDGRGAGITVDEIADAFAEALRETNPAFDARRFLHACGVQIRAEP